MRWPQWFVKAILAGMAISMGGVVLLQTVAQCGPEYKWVGAIFFAVGLYMVVLYGLNLYTGKVGYILENDRTYLVEVLVTIIGNLVGCLIIGYFFQLTGAVTMCQTKLDNFEFVDVLMKGVMCGLLMYFAVDTYKTKGTPLGVFIAVPVFIMAGFEHSIADMFYFSSAMMWNLDSAVFIITVLLGNLIGCCLLPAYRLYIEPIGAEKEDQ